MHQYRAAGMMFVSVFSYALTYVAVRLISHLPAAEIAFVRSVSAGLLTYAGVRLTNGSLRTPYPGLLIARGAAGGLAVLLFYYCVHVMPLASATIAVLLAPVFTTIVAIPLLREVPARISWVLIALAFAGAALMKGFDPRISIIGWLAVLGAAFFSGAAHVFIRMLRTGAAGNASGIETNPDAVALYFHVVTGIMTIALALPMFFGAAPGGPFGAWVWPATFDWPLLIGTGVLSWIAEWMLSRAFQIEDTSAAILAGIRYLSIVFSLVFGYLLFNETYPRLAFAGMMLTVIAVAANVVLGRR